MKKKIKDLTLEEIKTICKKVLDCDACPLYDLSPCPGTIYDNDLEREIEINESTNEKY